MPDKIKKKKEQNNRVFERLLISLKNNLQFLLDKEKINPKILSRKTGIPYATILKILQDSSNPTLESLSKLCSYYNFGIGQLFGEGGDSSEGIQANYPLPLILWDMVIDYLSEKISINFLNHKEWLSTEFKLSNNAFAVTLDSGYEPIFKRGSTLIIDTTKKSPEFYDNNFVLIQQLFNKPVIKKFILDANKIFLAPINPSLPTMEIANTDTVLGHIIEVRLSSKEF